MTENLPQDGATHSISSLNVALSKTIEEVVDAVNQAVDTVGAIVGSLSKELETVVKKIGQVSSSIDSDAGTAVGNITQSLGA